MCCNLIGRVPIASGAPSAQSAQPSVDCRRCTCWKSWCTVSQALCGILGPLPRVLCPSAGCRRRVPVPHGAARVPPRKIAALGRNFGKAGVASLSSNSYACARSSASPHQLRISYRLDSQVSARVSLPSRRASGQSFAGSTLLHTPGLDPQPRPRRAFSNSQWLPTVRKCCLHLAQRLS